ncbi:hypothetical protein BX600DRAFT_441265 [Xylariales sp. PMI_506]|nr:hypothetical protein BX600DRAFT_441265 [Xylariales sp. PMI_506]
MGHSSHWGAGITGDRAAPGCDPVAEQMQRGSRKIRGSIGSEKSYVTYAAKRFLTTDGGPRADKELSGVGRDAHHNLVGAWQAGEVGHEFEATIGCDWTRSGKFQGPPYEGGKAPRLGSRYQQSQVREPGGGMSAAQPQGQTRVLGRASFVAVEGRQDKVEIRTPRGCAKPARD